VVEESKQQNLKQGCAHPSHRWQQDAGEDTGSDLARAPRWKQKKLKKAEREMKPLRSSGTLLMEEVTEPSCYAHPSTRTRDLEQKLEVIRSMGKLKGKIKTAHSKCKNREKSKHQTQNAKIDFSINDPDRITTNPQRLPSSLI
jgi:hypothetical protein